MDVEREKERGRRTITEAEPRPPMEASSLEEGKLVCSKALLSKSSLSPANSYE